jgi:hypothetical protein
VIAIAAGTITGTAQPNTGIISFAACLLHPAAVGERTALDRNASN